MPGVLQINHRNNKAASFCQFIRKEDFDMALIQEP